MAPLRDRPGGSRIAAASSVLAVESCDQRLRRDRPVGLTADLGQLRLGDVLVEPHPAPPPRTDARRSEEPVRLTLDELFLGTRRCCAPEVGEPVAMVAVRPDGE